MIVDFAGDLRNRCNKYSLSNRYIPSPANESFVIDSWTGDIYDIQGNNLSKLHENLSNQDFKRKSQPDKIQ